MFRRNRIQDGAFAPGVDFPMLGNSDNLEYKTIAIHQGWSTLDRGMGQDFGVAQELRGECLGYPWSSTLKTRRLPLYVYPALRTIGKLSGGVGGLRFLIRRFPSPKIAASLSFVAAEQLYGNPVPVPHRLIETSFLHRADLCGVLVRPRSTTESAATYLEWPSPTKAAAERPSERSHRLRCRPVAHRPRATKFRYPFGEWPWPAPSGRFRVYLLPACA